MWSQNIDRCMRMIRSIRSGVVWVNTYRQAAPQVPFGGMKGSGYGRFGGKAGIDSFTELRWITVETQPGRYPI